MRLRGLAGSAAGILVLVGAPSRRRRDAGRTRHPCRRNAPRSPSPRWRAGSIWSADSEAAARSSSTTRRPIGGDSGQRRQPICITPAPAPSATGCTLYVVGGYTQSWEPVASTLVYEPARDQWREAAPMPTARGALAVAVLDGRIHAVGGVGAGRRNTNAHEVYDPTGDRWTALPPLPTPRDHHAAAVIDGRLYAVGGRVDGSYARNLAVNEEYDPRTSRWRTRAPLPTARSGIVAVVRGGRIFVFGGEAPAGTFDQTEAYEPASDAWSTWAPMPTPRHGLGAAAVDERIFVISGGPRPGGSYSRANEVFTP